MLELYPWKSSFTLAWMSFTFLVSVPGWCFFPKAFQIRNHSFSKYVEVNKNPNIYRVILGHCSYELLHFQLPFTTIHFFKEISQHTTGTYPSRTNSLWRNSFHLWVLAMPLVMLPWWQLLTCAIGSGEASALTFRGAFCRGGRSILGGSFLWCHYGKWFH